MKQKSNLNKTIEPDFSYLPNDLIFNDIKNNIIWGNFEEIWNLIETKYNTIIFDPPYNLSKDFGHINFKKMDKNQYRNFFKSNLLNIKKLLKEDGTLFICLDWQTGLQVSDIIQENFYVLNKIVWGRDKGRGSNCNWKNNYEEIWHLVVNKNKYKFFPENIKILKPQLAPYKDSNGNAKDWFIDEASGKPSRLTYHSNFWQDIVIPFWSMPENTSHPTQKPEKLIAKLILSTTEPGDIILDPMAGSGTTGIVAQKLGRKFTLIEISKEWISVIYKRFSLLKDNNIQGYKNGYFLSKL